MKFNELMSGYPIQEWVGEPDCMVKNVVYDSRKVVRGSIFVCIEGYSEDGHRYITSAIDRGAVGIVAQRLPKQKYEVPVAVVEDTREAIAFMANRFYQEPSKKFAIVGVTGTKGKTTTTHMLQAILQKAGEKVGLIGTISNSIGDKVIDAQRTTPEAVDLQGYFARMVEEGVKHCAMEVSSHALALKRVAYTHFKVGVFTNLSRDHMDFHETFEHYFASKLKLFELCDVGVVNIDTDYGKEAAKRFSDKILTVAIDENADMVAKNVELNKESVRFEVVSENLKGWFEIPIPGNFTVHNALCAIASAAILGVDYNTIQEGLKGVKVPGRADIVDIDKEYTVMIDYAHTPDSLQNILETVKQFAKGRLISVFGCGGDRDKTKRPIMGKISGEIADFSVVTSDNPRTENPDEIIAQIETGIRGLSKEYVCIVDRRDAIRYAMSIARKDDVVVIAGKGHETYQILANKKIDFDEQKIVKEIAKELP